ncbi:hypothetical protein V8E51_005712 [Hyaloscypha variabilis]
MNPWWRRSYTNTRRYLVQGDTEMERCDTLMVPIFQRSRLRRRVVCPSLFAQSKTDFGPPRTGSLMTLPGQQQLHGSAWLCLATCMLAGVSCSSTHRDRQVGRYCDFEKRRSPEIESLQQGFWPLANDARSLLLRGRFLGAFKTLFCPVIFQDLRHPPSEVRNLQDDRGGGADSTSTSAWKSDSRFGYSRITWTMSANRSDVSYCSFASS